MFSIIGMIVFGLIVGALAKALMPGSDPGGWILTCLLGIAGSVVAGFLGRLLGLYAEGDAAGWIMSILGAVLILYGYRLYRAKAIS